MKVVKTVDEFFDSQEKWNNALNKFREILLKTDLEETLKWGTPVYALDGKHVVGMGVFKSYVGLWFYQGALLSDPQSVLINANEAKTKALRQMRFTSEDTIDFDMVRRYISEAIANQKAGREIKPDKEKPLIIPEELEQAMKIDPELKECFVSINLTKRREYAEYVGDPVRPDTRQKRLEKVIPMIKDRIGLNDKYRK